MSQYNSYAKKLNEAFVKASEQQRDAYDVYKAAEEAKKAGIDINGKEYYPEQKKAEMAKLEANYQQAKADMKATQSKAWREFTQTRDTLGRELEKEVNAALAMNPDSVDENVITLLKSGMMTANDYQELYNRYVDNPTMRRMIGNEAKKAADSLEGQKSDQDLEDRRTLTAIAYDSRNRKADVLNDWDNLCNVAAHYSGETSRDRDPAYVCKMTDHWTDDNVQEAIRNF